MSAINDYMKEITEIDTLNIMEERKLFELIKDGDEDAKQKMIVSNLRLVAKIAHDYKGYGVPLEDLIGAGNVGLMKAVEKYEFGKGTKFSTYASLWIKNQIRREIDYVGRTISFCCNTLDKMRKIKKLKDDMGDDFNIEEVAKEMKSSKGYVACWANGYSQVSLNEPISSEDNHELGDIIADEKTDCVNHHADNYAYCTDLEVRMSLGKAYAYDILPSLRASGPQNESGAYSASYAAYDRREYPVIHYRHCRHGYERQEG
jgi:RNA polymerase primary sigma factor